jgi:NAD(P)-dependent dehydrogenase (short-subunit alcohol dehydrogenase family)
MPTARRDPVLITGATGGLGRQLALALSRRGRPLLIGGRRPDAVGALVSEIQRTGTPARPFIADLANVEDLRRAIDDLAGTRLHGIVANAGMTTRRDARSVDGFELTFAVNVLAHQLLLCRLAPQIVEGGRVVVLSSGVHEPDNQLARRLGVPEPNWVGTRNLALPDEADADARLAAGPIRYATSKLGNVLQARGLQAELQRAGRSVDVFAIDPGLMVDTDLARELPAFPRAVFRGIGRLFTPFIDNMRLSTVSAEHIASLVEDPRWEGRGFAYLDGDRVKSPSPDAQRDDLMAELWEQSALLLGLES